MTRVGLISDTHGRLPGRVFEIFANVDRIFHAGDVGREEVLVELETLAPVTAVYGNTDTFLLVSRLQRLALIQVEQLSVALTHIVNSPRFFYYQLFKENKKADVVVYGHTHVSAVNDYRGVMFVNPGSVVNPRQGTRPSVAILTVTGREKRVEFFNL